MDELGTRRVTHHVTRRTYESASPGGLGILFFELQGISRSIETLVGRPGTHIHIILILSVALKNPLAHC
ncbi:hypothetical protein CY34DRAFT_345990 [Suillus luteus UH-Slu-Lm8-n1]|uniref:Unplaced genomic scaffold CY34scaffold_220, whole genome shotgun sequence n=1 Tax=Suillus luteus UH-Slu-Lm8-n1 TaxID=930992 RepID=A0A0D0AY00_9AGAM|nr:hypothetical protein CY34DRAFT_345990 [Suillus luteus UH-Slu-Lm8-n1]